MTESAGDETSPPETESEATPDRLWADIVELAGDEGLRRAMAERARERARPQAARKIAAELIRIVEAR